MFKNLFRENAHPVNLAVVRMMLLALFAIPAILGHDVTDILLRNFQDRNFNNRIELPYTEFILNLIPLSNAAVEIIKPILTFSLIFSFVGLFTRISLFVYSLCMFYILLITVSFGKVPHNHHLFLFPLLLSFSHCGDALSLDSFIRKKILKKEVDCSNRDYKTPIVMGSILLGVIYFFPGI